MSDLTISATFTKNSGQPATGLDLADIEITLVRQHKATGVDEEIWSAQNPTEEIDNVGSYIAIYSGANLSVYNYFANIQYTGLTTLDTNYVSGTASASSVGASIGTATAVNIAYALPRTHLSIFDFARIFGINPIHFAGGQGSPLFADTSCDAVWSRHLWQQPDQESWESILIAIQDAEKTVRNYLGYQPAPWWVSGRKLDAFKTFHNHFTNGINGSQQRAAVILQEGHIIAPGRRAVTAIATGASVTYTDEDSDNWYETAQVVVPYTETYDWREIKIYFSGRNGDPRWEIRPIYSIDVANDELTIVLRSWQLVDPDAQARFPGTDGLTALDLSTLDYFVPTVDIYREYNDTTATAAEFIWEKMPEMGTIAVGVGADESTQTTQNGTLIVRNNGIAAPIAASYSEENGWAMVQQTVARSPDRYRLWYYSGYISQEWEQGFTGDPLDSAIAMAIAYLAAARLSRGVCQCGERQISYLREPNGFTSPAGNFLAVADVLQECPFGTRRGEWMAYKMLQSPNMVRHMKVAVG